jgi:hypothetical protein
MSVLPKLTLAKNPEGQMSIEAKSRQNRNEELPQIRMNKPASPHQSGDQKGAWISVTRIRNPDDNAI